MKRKVVIKNGAKSKLNVAYEFHWIRRTCDYI